MTNRTPRLEIPRVMYALEKILKARKQWDEAPELGYLVVTAKGTRTFPLPLPDEAWAAAGDPKNVVRHILGVLRSGRDTAEGEFTAEMRAAVPPEMAGLYWRAEGWAPPEELAWDIHDQRKLGMKTPRFKDLEGRRELRFAHAVDYKGVLYMARQERGGPVTTDYDDSSRSGYQVDGDMPMLLMELLMELRPDHPTVL